MEYSKEENSWDVAEAVKKTGMQTFLPNALIDVQNAVCVHPKFPELKNDAFPDLKRYIFESKNAIPKEIDYT